MIVRGLIILDLSTLAYLGRATNPDGEEWQGSGRGKSICLAPLSRISESYLLLVMYSPFDRLYTYEDFLGRVRGIL